MNRPARAPEPAPPARPHAAPMPMPMPMPMPAHPPAHASPVAPPSAAATEPLRRIGRSAVVALYDELALAPKPGLVSFVDSGSHADMDAGTFLRSLFALRHYFGAVTRLGAAGARFAELEAAGIAAEQQMLRATAGINTHRGAIFSLGLLCASAGRCWQRDGAAPSPRQLRQALLAHWGDALAQRSERTLAAAQPATAAINAAVHRPAPSNGQRAAAAFALRSAGAEAALGFPVLFEHALPALRAASAAGLAADAARLQALFAVMAVLDDTNLVHRGGLAGLRDAQRAARDFLAAGGAARPDARAHAEAIHRAFVARRLSPGGSADLLAAACWADRVCARDAAPR